MSEVVERVAAALWGISGGDEDAWAWDECPEEQRAGYRIHARAAIEAMREPTESMWAAGDDLVPFGPDVADPSAVYRAMIDEALKP